ncbi:ABC transporter ATP-binding protein [Methanimicrococcus blatticola]|uniref:ATP-binding cassette subfamily B protein n=1 Tax=Methanimicrococcus blatticola TaxID=91560 RepID=A0A484F5G9_9EURY|nr:ABC transporter ATP-binding protein [Methanimicrococcus blatticola]MBZ3934850.1 ABC transporter ATP-binding protein/permease [Methanimicrococcus blatticola]MCC2509052.1 ABC transporter ATP-binding protein/permease [Methanimicrococcus blatticola]TDQ70924.1 ATP-binding cassette subfamily B protein [Methanimicrococcus blatticola]
MSGSSREQNRTFTGRQRRGGPGGPGGPGFLGITEKPQNFKKTLKRLLGYLKPHRIGIAVVLILAVLSTAFSVLAPLLIGDIVNVLFEGVIGSDSRIAGINFSAVTTLLVLLFGLYVGSSLFAYAQQYIMAGITQKVVSDLRVEVGSKLSRLRLKYYDSHTHGEIMSRILSDVDTISNTLQQGIVQLITSAITIIGILVIMIYLNPLLTLICFLILPVSAVLTKVIVNKSQPYFKHQQERMADMNGHVEEMYTGHKIIKAFNREQKASEKFDGINDDLYDVGWKSQFISGIAMPVLFSVQNIGYVFVCIIGCLFVLAGSMNIGNVQSFILYSKQFTQPISQISTVITTIQSTIAAAEHVFEILDEEEEQPDSADAISVVNPDGAVVFDHVSFGYESGKTVIHDLNLNIYPGESVAIVGPTGAGKTTILNLLMRFYEIDGGRILIDGTDITQMKRNDLRNMFGMVLQTPWLFNGTVRENIAYGREDATDEEVIRAAEAAYADAFIQKLPQGYETVINEDASNISEGQKQMLTIARAFLSDPVILLLDEATSNVDTLTEVHIKDAMTTLMKGRTSFVIAHRLSTVKNADLILVINHGEIIEQGNHDELMAEGGFYAMLYNSQFSSDNLDETFRQVEKNIAGKSTALVG